MLRAGLYRIKSNHYYLISCNHIPISYNHTMQITNYSDFLVEGLTILKNRGYDSAGIATMTGNPDDGLVSTKLSSFGGSLVLLILILVILTMSLSSLTLSHIFLQPITSIIITTTYIDCYKVCKCRRKC